MNITNDVKTLVKRYDKVRTDRQALESHWDDISKYFLPTRQETFYEGLQGKKFDTDVYDNVGMVSVQVAAAGTQGYLVNPSERWFALSIGADGKKATDWLHSVEQIIFDALNKSNFNEQIHEAFLDLYTFGTACFYVEESGEDDVTFYTRPMPEIFIVEDRAGKVDTVFRFFKMTARQAHQMWGNKAGESVQKHLDADKPEEEVEFLQVVFPREERDSQKKDSLNMPYASVWIDYKKQEKIVEGGYNEFPFLTPRYSKTSGKNYGYSPAMVCLPDMKTLNNMVLTTLKAAQKLVDPPLVLPDQGYLLPFDTTPGAINFKNASLQAEMDVLQIPHQLPVGMDMQEQRREAIRTALFADLFMMLATLRDKQMTAHEVSERVNERLLVLAPVLGRLMKELLQPLITRVFNILERKGKIPEAPEEVQGLESSIEFISPLAMAQKAAKAGTINQMLSVLLGVGQSIPQIIDRIDDRKVADEVAKTFNLDNLLREEEEVQEIREQRAEIEAQDRQLDMAEKGTKAAKNAAEAEEKGKWERR